MMIKNVVFAALLFWEIVFSDNAHGQSVRTSVTKDTFQLAINRPEETCYYKWVELIYEEVFRRIRMNLKIDYYPIKRASIEANAGRVDGEGGRIYEYGKSFNNMIRVDEPVFSIEIVACTGTPEIRDLHGWQSLTGKNYLVEYPRGMKICENNLAPIIKEENLSTITEAYQGLRKLANRRTDIYIDDLNAVNSVLLRGQNGLNKKIWVAGTMQKVLLYMYVHNKNIDMIPKLEQTIRELKKEGLIRKFQKEAFNIYP